MEMILAVVLFVVSVQSSCTGCSIVCCCETAPLYAAPTSAAIAHVVTSDVMHTSNGGVAQQVVSSIDASHVTATIDSCVREVLQMKLSELKVINSEISRIFMNKFCSLQHSFMSAGWVSNNAEFSWIT